MSSTKCSIFRCEAIDTVDIRHEVLWPNHPIEHVLLPDDAHGFHFACALEEQGSPASATSLSESEENSSKNLKIVGVISFFVEPLPVDSEPLSNSEVDLDFRSNMTTNSPARSPALAATTALRFRKFAVLPDYQGTGLGSQLLYQGIKLAITAAVELVSHSDSVGDISYIWCDARESARRFYERRGMRELLTIGGRSDRFFKGDIPYLRMVMDVDKAIT